MKLHDGIPGRAAGGPDNHGVPRTGWTLETRDLPGVDSGARVPGASAVCSWTRSIFPRVVQMSGGSVQGPPCCS